MFYQKNNQKDNTFYKDREESVSRKNLGAYFLLCKLISVFLRISIQSLQPYTLLG